MVPALALALLVAAAAGLALLAVEVIALRRHLAQASPAPRERPAISVLKPLCGLDDELEQNLESFAALAWPEVEVLLGVASRADPAFALAEALALRFPRRFRVVIQRGEPGMNPKVNQLVTLAREARHDILVVSDSNVRVEAGYLAEIAAHLEDPGVGLVTHPISAGGERRLGALFDALHLTGCIAPAVVAAKRVARRDIVVGKSMALRRADLTALGGFEAAKDVLAEDYVLGCMISTRLAKRVALAHRPVTQVSISQGLGAFLGRYARWSVLHRTTMGRPLYLAQALLNPVLLAAAAAALDAGARTLAALGAVCAAKVALDAAAGQAMRPGGYRAWQLMLLPAKDLLVAWAWARAMFRSEVRWRGKDIRVLRGTRIAGLPVEEPASPWMAAPDRAR
jgi:ceramide glucosyltransferase